MLPSPIVLDTAAQDLLFRDARTASAFTPEPVTSTQIEALYDLVKWGPTTMNTQPLRMMLARSDAARATVISHLADGNKPKAESAPLIAVLAADVDFHTRLSRTFPHVPGAEALFADDDHRLRTAISQAWLQAGYVIVGIRALGLAAGPMLGYDAPGLDAALLSDTTWRSIMVVNIGHPAPNAWMQRLPRLDLDEVVVER